jgi:hypothetical protein
VRHGHAAIFPTIPKQAKQIADALRRALTELDFIFTHPEAIDAVTLAADIYDELSKGKPGRPPTPARFPIIDLVWRFTIRSVTQCKCDRAPVESHVSR